MVFFYVYLHEKYKSFATYLADDWRKMIGYFVHLISIVIYIIEIMVLVRGIVCLKMNKLPRGMYVVKNIINYYTAVITIFVIVDCVYYMLSENFNGILISSGIVLCIMLVISGKLFNLLYQWSKDKKAEDKLNESEKQYIWGWSALISSLFISFYNLQIALMAFSLFLGKYIWFDTGDSSEKIREAFSSIKDSEEIYHKNIIMIKNWILGITLIHSLVIKFIIKLC